jgi:hypothetical protein
LKTVTTMWNAESRFRSLALLAATLVAAAALVAAATAVAVALLG